MNESDAYYLLRALRGALKNKSTDFADKFKKFVSKIKKHYPQNYQDTHFDVGGKKVYGGKRNTMSTWRLENLFKPGYTQTGGDSWEDTLNKIEWVDDFREKFRTINPTRGGTYKEVHKRLVKFYKENDFDKQEILAAVDLYVEDMIKAKQDPKFLKSAHKFIYEGHGNIKSSMLEDYCNRYIDQDNTTHELDIDE